MFHAYTPCPVAVALAFTSAGTTGGCAECHQRGAGAAGRGFGGAGSVGRRCGSTTGHGAQPASGTEPRVGCQPVCARTCRQCQSSAASELRSWDCELNHRWLCGTLVCRPSTQTQRRQYGSCGKTCKTHRSVLGHCSWTWTPCVQRASSVRPSSKRRMQSWLLRWTQFPSCRSSASELRCVAVWLYVSVWLYVCVCVRGFTCVVVCCCVTIVWMLVHAGTCGRG